MSEYIATAKVRVRADTAGFREDLRNKIERSGSGVGSIKVPVIPEMKAFRKTLEAELRKKPIVVPVIADLKGGQLSKKLTAQVTDDAKKAAATGTKAATEGAAAKIAAEKTVTAVKADETAKQIALEKEQAAEARAAAALEADAAKKQLAANTTLTESEELLNAAQQRRLITVSTVGNVESASLAIKRLDAIAEETQAAAIAAGNTERAAEIQLLRNSLAAQLESIGASKAGVAAGLEQAAADKAAASAARERAAAQEALRRGAGSSALSFAGVRGATLAANAEFLAGAAAVAAFAKALNSAVQLETQLNVFRVTAKATGDQMETAAAQARELGRDITLPAVSAGDAAESFTNLAKAGLSVEDSLAGARGVLQLATAAQIDNAKATELTASALNAFGLEGKDAVRVADLLTGSANESQGSIEDVGIALQQSSAAARQAGISLEDTIAALTLLARNGIRGSDAGTSLRTALLRLISPTDKAQDQLNKLNVRIRDLEGNVRPEIFSDIAEATADFTAKQRDATFAIIFGQDAFRTQAILGREGSAGLNAMRDATQEVGLAAELAGARTAGLAGQMEALKNNLDTLGTSLGQVAIPLIGGLVSDLTEGVGAAEDFANAIRSITNVIPDIPGGDGFLGKILTGRAITSEMGTVRKEAGALIGVLRSGESLNPFQRPTDQLKELRAEFVDSIDDANDLFSTLENISKGAPIGGGLPGQFLGTDPETVKRAILELKDGIKGSTAEAQALRDRLDGVVRLITGLGRAPTIFELRAFFDQGFLESEFNKIQRRIEAHPFGLPILIDDQQVEKEANDAGTKAANAFALAFGATVTPQVASTLTNIFEGPSKSPTPFGTPAEDTGLGAGQVLSKVSVFDQRVVRAQIAKDVQAEIQALKEQQAFIEAQLGRADVQGQKSLKKKLENALLGSQNALQGVLDGISQQAEDDARKAKDASDKAKKAREDRHKAIIDGFDLRVQKQQNVLELKAATKWLGDDLTALKGLRRILRDIIKSGKLEADELAEFTSQLIQVDADIAAKNKEIADRRKERRDRIIESAELDVQLAEANKNIAKEIAARKRLIERLREAQKAAGRNSLEYKRLAVRIAQERAAIAELTGEQKKKKNAFAEMTFEFLQAQQGFAANLFGNLIPLSATPGLVGNASTGPANVPQVPGGGSGGPAPVRARRQDVESDAAVSRAQGAGPTRGQQTAVITVLRHILSELQASNAGRAHPEAKNQRVRSNASMDYGI